MFYVKHYGEMDEDNICQEGVRGELHPLELHMEWETALTSPDALHRAIQSVLKPHAVGHERKDQEGFGRYGRKKAACKRHRIGLIVPRGTLS